MKKQPITRRSAKKAEAELPLPLIQDTSFPVIGIGASAGGLEAIDLFLKNVPTPSGLAFVIVQHLDPTHKGIMVELLQRVTPMPVKQVTDRLLIEPDHVYVIPPNQDMTLLHGKLHLLDMVKPRGLRLPIDFFFRSLADDLQEHSIGVILSGMGSDGTLGLRAIKEKGGGVFVQDPSSAKFDGMPRSAIDEGLADIIAPVEALPLMIIKYLKNVPVVTKSPVVLAEKALSAMEKVIILLRTNTGHDFSLYKKNTIYRRIERRMGIHQIQKISDYVRYLQDNAHEVVLLFKELLIGVTSFFRDPAAWDALKTKGFPTIFASMPSGGILRAWVAGCSTGEEAYTLAITFREALASSKPLGNFRLQIFATDLDKDAIDKARTGIYPPNITADVLPDIIKKYFEKDDRGYRISHEIRETLVFAPHNVIMDPPFTKLDVLICRNLLIYMGQELQKKVIPIFNYSLNQGGILFLGSAETIGSHTNLFESLDSKSRLYRRLFQGSKGESMNFPPAFTHTVKGMPFVTDNQAEHKVSDFNLQSITDNYLLQNFAPAAVLINNKGDIIYISGRTGKYLEPAAGKANMNVLAMAREGLRYELNMLINHVIRQTGEITKKGLTIGTNGGTQLIDVTVKLIEKPDILKGLIMIVFTDVANRLKKNENTDTADIDIHDIRSQSLVEELKVAKDENIAIREQMQTSEEELKSTNEEMQSANEELQSTNEELTTSKEEMQSLNEELQTVNQELQSKVSDLSTTNNDMKNLLNSTDIATLFLDDELNIRRFTTRTASLIKLIGTDVGRPVTDIVSDLKYPALAEDAREVLRTLVFKEKEVLASENRWFTVRIMPYRTLENRIDGLVITFTDITLSKKLEQKLRDSEERFHFLFETMPVGSMFQDTDEKIVMGNQEAERITGIRMEDMQGRTLSELKLHYVREDGTEMSIHEHPVMVALRTGQPVIGFVMGIAQPNKDNTTRWIRVSASPRRKEETTKSYEVYLIFYEITKSA